MKNGDRFELIFKEGTTLKSDGMRQIMVDRETGVHYLMVTTAYTTSVTPLLGADGKPIVSGID